MVVNAANVHVLTPAADRLDSDEEFVYACGLLGHCQGTGDGSQDNGVQGGDETRRTHGPSRNTRRKVGESTRNGPYSHQTVGEAPIPGDQAALRRSEDQTAWTGQEPLQGQLAGAIEGPVNALRSLF